ncbi:MAG: hypothetical protein LBC52_04195 [Treponema sp.]|jgi:hypothetical protein|nr:hypothetical protein [Treponema sp.]
MKKVVFILLIAFLAIGALSAQGWGFRNAPESAKIDGTLQLHNGQFAVASGDNIYYVPMISRYVGFIENLKEGSNVSFEGYVFGNFLRPLKMTVSGKTYDLAGGGAFGNRNRGDFDNRRDRNFDRFGQGFGPGGPGTCCYGPGFGGNGPRDNFRGRR